MPVKVFSAESSFKSFRLSFSRQNPLILSAHKMMPAVAAKDNSIPTSPTAHGLGTVKTRAAIPSEFIPSGSRRNSFPRYTTIIIIPARVTEGVKPVIAIYAKTKSVISTNEIILAEPNFSKMRRRSIVTTAKCIPDTTIRYEVPVTLNASFISSDKACFSPIRTARAKSAASPLSESFSAFRIIFLTDTAAV